MSGGHTPGPWALETDDVWPFDLHIVGPDITIRRIAHSTRQNTLEDCRDAIGFKHEEREGIRAMVLAQEQDARLIAAAPELLEAAQKVLAGLHARIDVADPKSVPVFVGIADLSDAINKAKGDQP